jgi:hypothetical protein
MKEQWITLFKEMMKLNSEDGDPAKYDEDQQIEVDYAILHLAKCIWELNLLNADFDVAQSRMLITKSLFLRQNFYNSQNAIKEYVK